MSTLPCFKLMCCIGKLPIRAVELTGGYKRSWLLGTVKITTLCVHKYFNLEFIWTTKHRRLWVCLAHYSWTVYLFVDKTFEQSNLLTLTIVCRAFITREIQRQNCVHCKTSRSTGFEVFTGLQHMAFHCLFRYVTVKMSQDKPSFTELCKPHLAALWERTTSCVQYNPASLLQCKHRYTWGFQ